MNRSLNRLVASTGLREQVLRHLIVGGSGVAVNWLAFTLLRQYVGASTLISTLAAHGLLLALIFPAQKFFTFKSPATMHRQIARFLMNDAFYLSGDFALATLIIDVLGVTPALGKAIGLLILTPLSFASQKFWVFRHEPIDDLGSRNKRSHE